MTRIVVKELVWDEYNVEHIKKHNVSKDEAETAVKNFIGHRKAKKGRYIAIGKSKDRLISLVVEKKGPGIYYVVTARDSDKRERRIVNEKEKV